MDAFDADVLIYAASQKHPLGARVANPFHQDAEVVRMGSVILMSELLIKPTRLGWLAEKEQLRRSASRSVGLRCASVV